MTKMVGKTRGGGNFWASENWSGRAHFEGHSPKWRVLSKLSVQPCVWYESIPQNVQIQKRLNCGVFVVVVLLGCK